MLRERRMDIAMAFPIVRMESLSLISAFSASYASAEKVYTELDVDMVLHRHVGARGHSTLILMVRVDQGSSPSP